MTTPLYAQVAMIQLLADASESSETQYSPLFPLFVDVSPCLSHHVSIVRRRGLREASQRIIIPADLPPLPIFDDDIALSGCIVPENCHASNSVIQLPGIAPMMMWMPLVI